MRRIAERTRRAVVAGSLVLLAAAGCALIAWRITYSSVDYSADAGPAINALVHLDFGGFFVHESQMGMLTLLLRWPFAALANIWGGTQLDQYRLGLFACLIAAALIALVLGREMHKRGRSAAAIGMTVGLWFFNPASAQAINIGHPEEIVGGALCVLGVLVAGRESPVPGGAALGLALATKQWALAAAPPVLLAARNPLKTGAVALAVWLPLELPLVLANFDAYTRVGRYGVVMGVPSGLWWPVSPLLPDSVIVGLARPLVLAAALGVSVLVWRRHGGRTTESQLALLALVLLLRVLLDPTGNQYFATPFVMALVAFEGISSRRLPVVSLATVVLIGISFRTIRILSWEPAVTNLFYLAWALPLALWLWRSAARGVTQQV